MTVRASVTPYSRRRPPSNPKKTTIMNEKQQQLLFDKGITNVPSDALCSDNTLAESVGMVYDNGEHRVIQRPVAYTPSAMITKTWIQDEQEYEHDYSCELIIIHRFNNVLRHILRVTDATEGVPNERNNLYCVIDDSVNPKQLGNEPISGEIHAETIGNTLVISASDGLHYFLWDYQKGEYRNLGSKVPDIQMRFTISDVGYLGIDSSTGEPYTNPTQEQSDDLDPSNDHIIPGLDGIGSDDPDDPNFLDREFVGSEYINATGSKWSGDNGHEDGKVGLVGLVSARLNWVKQRRRFAFPFWARSAVRLYDGSYVNISNPFLLLPSVLNNWEIFSMLPESPYTPRIMDDEAGGWPHANYMPLCGKMNYYSYIPSGVDLSDWEDIISGVDIFISEEVKSFDLEGSWKILNLNSNEQNPTQPAVTTSDTCMPIYGIKKTISKHTFGDSSTWHTYYKPSLLTESEMMDRLVKQSVFYRVIELDRDEVIACAGSSHAVDSSSDNGKMDRHALINLTTQPTLENDDYFSRNEMMPQIIKSYNGRLHLSDVERGFFPGFTRFSYTAYTVGSHLSPDYDPTKYLFYVHIKSEDGERVVGARDTTYEIYNVWFYYPDPRAYQVDVYKNVGTNENPQYKKLATFSLTEHPHLHGAYYFGHLPTSVEEKPTGTTDDLPTIYEGKELLEGQVIVSEVNNPWLFKAEGYVTVGMGRILGLASQTVALGQEEHGIHPLIVFCERGISTLRLNNEGVYIRSDELSREVCSNSKSITETDGAVFFVSNKGLMVIIGNQVKCVSEQVMGKKDSWATDLMADIWATELTATSELDTFSMFFNRCFIAYDYRDSLLWMFNGESQYCLIYSIKSGTFTKMKPLTTSGVITRVINNYPDYLLESGTSLFSLADRDDINVLPDAGYDAKMLTRPMKLENALALKSIMEVRNIRFISGDRDPSMKLTVYASNNLKNWVKLTSLRGTPWLYYRFLYEFTNLVPTDRFSGTVLVTQERRINKLRTYFNDSEQVGRHYSVTAIVYDHQTQQQISGVITIPKNQQKLAIELSGELNNAEVGATYYYVVWVENKNGVLYVARNGEGSSFSGLLLEPNANAVSIIVAFKKGEPPTTYSNHASWKIGVTKIADDTPTVNPTDDTPSSDNDPHPDDPTPVPDSVDPQPTPTTGSITLRINNNSGQTIALSGKMILCIKNLATSADAWGSSNQLDIPFEVPTAQGGWPHFWSNPRVIADGQTETIVISTFTQYFGTDIDGQLRTETHNIGEWFGKFFVASDSPQNIAARANHQLGGTPAVLLGVAEKKSTETSVSNSSNLVYASPIAGANNPVEIVDGGEYDINIVDVVTYYLSGADTYDVALVQGGDNLYIRTLRT